MFPARFHPWLAALAAPLVISTFGCSAPPERTSAWTSDEKVLQPAGSEAKATGSLIVETVYIANDNGVPVRNEFSIYDEQGRYLDHFPNRKMSPVPLPAGRYVVVTHVFDANRRVQVVVKEGQTTTVRLSDFKAAPEAP